MDIVLTLINRSDSNAQVVIFQKPVPLLFSAQPQQAQAQQQVQQQVQRQEQTTAAAFSASLPATVAWTVLSDFAPGQSRTFKFPIDFSVGAADAYGNNIQPVVSQNGQKWKIARSPDGQMLQPDNQAASQNEIDIQNQLHNSAVAQIYRDGKLLSLQSLAPQQTAAFSFDTKIWLGVIPGVQEGQIMDAATVAEASAEVSLEGLTKASLIMTGGGSGSDARPIIFVLSGL